MKIEVKRKYKKGTYTIGKLYVNGKYVCDTLEDKDRGLFQGMSELEVSKIKVKNETAIPTGTYEVSLHTVSPRFGSQTFYKSLCGGCVPRLLNVPGVDGILIHCGNTDKDSSGCILVGKNTVAGKVLNSKATFTDLWNKYLSVAKRMGEKVTIIIS